MIDALVAHYSKDRHTRVFAGNKETFSYFEGQLELFTDERGNAGTFHLHPNQESGNRLAQFWTESIIAVCNRH